MRNKKKKLAEIFEWKIRCVQERLPLAPAHARPMMNCEIKAMRIAIQLVSQHEVDELNRMWEEYDATPVE